jgi:antitoxin component HigA of HigAB toxin-antitoxin module
MSRAPPRLITFAQYRQALDRATQLAELDPDPDTFEGHELTVLSAQLEVYELEHWPFPKPSAAQLAAWRKKEARE